MKRLFQIILFPLVGLSIQLAPLSLNAQFKVGNFPSTRHKAAVLELESGNQGLLLTRVADTNSVNLFSPPDGMIIYFTDGDKPALPGKTQTGVYERNNGIWKKLGTNIDTAVSTSQTAIKFTIENGVYVLHLPNATTGLRGVVSSGVQSFSGRKTFKDSVAIENLHPGSIIFIRDDSNPNNNVLTENNINFFWDNKNTRLGVKTNVPNASLDVKGNFKLGANGAILNNIIRDSMITSSPISLITGNGSLYSFPLPNVKAGANVMVSPQNNLPDGCIIAYSYSTAGTIHIRIENIKDITIPANTKFYVTIIQ